MKVVKMARVFYWMKIFANPIFNHSFCPWSGYLRIFTWKYTHLEAVQALEPLCNKVEVI